MKTLFKKLRKGFTIVELVIVIAVIAILAAVLIPTLANVIESANESVDMQTVKNLNTIVSAYDTVGEIETPADALDGALENGYSVGNLTPTSEGNMIVYDENSNRFALVSNSWETVYKDSATTKDSAEAWDTATTWIIVTTSDATLSGTNTYTLDGNNSYILVGEDWNGATVTVKYGAILYDYSNTVTLASVIINNSDQSAQKEVVKADSASDTKTAINKSTIAKANDDGTIDTLTVKVIADYLSCTTSGFKYTIKNYSTTTATAVNSCTYLEYGTTSIYDATNINGGTITNYSKTISNVTISVASGSSSSSIYTDTTGNVTTEDTTTTIGSLDGTLELGTVNYPYLIDSVNEWISSLTNSNKRAMGYYWEVTADLDFSASSSYSVSGFVGNIDFNDHSVILNKSTDDNWLFNTVYASATYGDSSISNLNLTVYKENGLICYTSQANGNITLSNITISGVFESNVNYTAPFIGYSTGNKGTDYTLTYSNCVNYANITSNASASSAIFLGGIYSAGSYYHFENCINYGTLIHAKTNSYASMLVGNGAAMGANGYLLSENRITVVKCVNYGKIYGNGTTAENAGAFSTNLFCGAGSQFGSISEILQWVEDNKANLYNGEDGECGDVTFTELKVTEDGEFDLDVSTSTSATSYSISFTFWVTTYEEEGGKTVGWGSYPITITVSKLSAIESFPAYSWICESALPEGAETVDITVGDKTLTTYTVTTTEGETTTSTTYYVFNEDYVSDWGGSYVTISSSVSLTIYEYIGSSVGNIYTYTYTN